MERIRYIKLFKSYYKEFYLAQTQTVRDKINFVLRMVETQRIIAKKFFRFIEGSDGIYEIRVEIESNIYRVFCCMDEGGCSCPLSWNPKEKPEDPTKRNKTSRDHQKRIFKKQGGKVMEARKREAIMACETFDDLLNAEYGERGTVEREKFEVEAETFCLAECLKEQRRLAGLTQEQLAAKIGTKKSYISKIENGHTDIQLSTLFRIFSGLGKRVTLSVL